MENSGVSSAELEFGTPPSLPGQFLLTPEILPTEFLNNLHHLVDPFVLPPLIHGSMPPSGPVRLPPALWEAEYLFVRQDGLWPSLTPLYNKPILVSGPVVPAMPQRCGRPP